MKMRMPSGKNVLLIVTLLATLAAFQNCSKMQPIETVMKTATTQQAVGAQAANPRYLVDGFPATIDGKSLNASQSIGDVLPAGLNFDPVYNTLVTFNCGSPAQSDRAEDPKAIVEASYPDRYLIEKPPVRFHIINTSDTYDEDYNLKAVCSFDDKDNVVRDFILNNKLFNYVSLTALMQEGCPQLANLIGNLPSRKFSFIGESSDDKSLSYHYNLLSGTMVLIKNSLGRVVAFQEQGMTQWVSTLYDKNKSNPNCDRSL